MWRRRQAPSARGIRDGWAWGEWERDVSPSPFLVNGRERKRDELSLAGLEGSGRYQHVCLLCVVYAQGCRMARMKHEILHAREHLSLLRSLCEDHSFLVFSLSTA